eukprot:GHVR01137236.1.p1 GENE.GHVR01137236.1~~GHVR01137236.1.p1  ORF type:complete len:487 (+),score=135.24 GHVR01137236.1:620-2080(+)
MKFTTFTRPAGSSDNTVGPPIVMVCGTDTQVDGGYKVLEREYNEMAVYEQIEATEIEGGALFMWFNGGWMIGPNVGGGDYFKSTDITAFSPLEIQGVWLNTNNDESELSVVAIEPPPDPSEEEKKYTDPDFPPTLKSLGQKAIENGSHLLKGRDPSWVRCVYLSHKIEVEPLFLKDISPNDLKQGSLGNCWLVAAITALAEFPHMISRLFKNKEIQKDGRYEIHLYNPNACEWVCVCVDDYIPCEPKPLYVRGGTPLATSCDDSAVWGLLLEKAIAKLAGSYSKLIGGLQGKAWTILTGCHRQWLFKVTPEGAWERRKVITEYSSLDEYFEKNETEEGDTFSSPLEFFKMLQEFDNKEYLMGAGITPTTGYREYRRPDGLIEGHAYTLLSALEINGVKLLRLRNPWANSVEWNGRWADICECWETRPDVREAVVEYVRSTVGPVNWSIESDDGCFFMEFEDFRNIWTSVSVCPHSCMSTIDIYCKE